MMGGVTGLQETMDTWTVTPSSPSRSPHPLHQSSSQELSPESTKPWDNLFEYHGGFKKYIGKPCKWGHRWEECNSDLYVTGIGVLTDRECQECKARFAPKGKGRKRDEKPQEGEMWLSGRSLACHCLDCKVAACKKCVPKLEDEEHSPRKNKKAKAY